MSEINLGTLVYDIIANDKTATGTESASKNIDKIAKAGMVVGGAATAIGFASNELVGKAKDIDASIGSVAVTMGVADDSVRTLMLSMTDADHPMNEVLATFDQLSKAGVKNTDDMKGATDAFFKLSDATGTSADVLVQDLTPALHAFNIPVSQIGDHMDTVTWSMKNTNYTMSEWSNVMEKVSPKTADLGLTFEDTAAIIKTLSDRGEDGRTAISDIDKAITSSKGNRDDFYASLGITAKNADDAAKGIADTKGKTEDFAKIADSKHTTFDTFQSDIGKLAYQLGEAAKPMDPLNSGLQAMGPTLIGISGTLQGINAIGGISGALSLGTAGVLIGGVVVGFWGLSQALGEIAKWLGASPALVKIYQDSWHNCIPGLSQILDIANNLDQELARASAIAQDLQNKDWTKLWHDMQTTTTFSGSGGETGYGATYTGSGGGSGGSYGAPTTGDGKGGYNTGSGTVIHYGGRASGGPVSSGTPYIVGEAGPELFVPGQSGTIIPNGGSSTPVEVHVYIDSTKIIKALAPGMGNIRRITTGAR